MAECDVPPAPPVATNDDDEEEPDYALDDEDDDDDLDDLSCGELPEGGCSLAGTEWCDWKCSHSAGMLRRMNEKPE